MLKQVFLYIFFSGCKLVLVGVLEASYEIFLFDFSFNVGTFQNMRILDVGFILISVCILMNRWLLCGM